MELLPAIDLMGGRCVRLIQGRYDHAICYDNDPVTSATQFRDAGARWLHIIDLDGARDGQLANLPALAAIIKQTGLRVQFGGGVRSEEAIQAALDAGVQRVILGTRALLDWEWFRDIVHRPEYANRLTLGLDAVLGQLRVEGWTANAPQRAEELASSVEGWPLAGIVYTDIGRDGCLLGPNIDAIDQFAAHSTIPVVASGGVSDLEDVRALAKLNLAGVVVGRALYEQTLDLRAALDVLNAGD